MEYSIFDSPNYRKIMKYHPDMESYQELVSEINEAEGEYNSQLEQQDIQIEELEKIKKQVVEDGVDKGLMTTIVGITGKDDLLETRGLSLESFSSYPSRINVSVALEELDEKSKNILIGGGIVLAVAFIIKVIKKLYEFFKGRKTKVADVKTLQEKVQEKVQSAKMAEMEMNRAINEVDGLRATYEEIQKTYADRMVRVDEAIDDACTGLLQKVIKDSGTKDLVSKVFSEFDTYTAAIMAMTDAAGKINTSIDTWLADGTFLNNVQELYNDAVAGTPPKTMRENIKKLMLDINHLRDLAKMDIEPTKEFRDKLGEFIQTKRDLGFINNLEKWSAIEDNKALTPTNNKLILDTLEDLGKRLAELKTAHAQKAKKEDIAILNEFVNYFKEVVDVYLKITLLFQEITNGWVRLLRAVENRYKTIGSMVKDAIKKVVFSDSEKQKFKYLERYIEDNKGT